MTILSRTLMLLLGFCLFAPSARADEPEWAGPMKQVHARFTGTPGTFAHFGDSITVSLAYWAPLAGKPANMSPEMARAHELVKRYLKPDCWAKWRGGKFGSE